MFSFLCPQPHRIGATFGSVSFQHGVIFDITESAGLLPHEILLELSGKEESGAPGFLPVAKLPPRFFEIGPASCEQLRVKIHIRNEWNFGDAYRLEITQRDGVRIVIGQKRGMMYALQTLEQLVSHFGGMVPCLVCEDAPDLAVRGFMLDISRCKVPTMETLKNLVPQLAALRINQLQLYTEHTFAFREHEEVWRDASPMTTAEYGKLREWCDKFCIELVPNLQSFGHMERWLKHDAYRHLAECPDGFYHELAGAHRAASTLKPDAASLEFMAKLYDEYLPAFGNLRGQFNIGGDEPWELGMGWSKPLCEARGRHTVYREHLAALVKLVESRGKRAQFWADILLEDPEHAGDVPASAVPVLWGYDAGHPFAEQCGVLQRLGRRFLVAPGTSVWQSFHGRLDNALANVREAVDAAYKYCAAGLLLTSWGDNGNHQPWWAFYPALAAAGMMAWNFSAHKNLAATEGRQALAKITGKVFLEEDTDTARRLIDAGTTDNFFSKQIRNKSIFWELLFAAPDALRRLVAEIPEREIAAALEHLRVCVDAIRPASAEAVLAQQEAMMALTLAALGARRAELFRKGETPEATEIYTAKARRVAAAYREVWLRRARAGGLDESAAKIG